MRNFPEEDIDHNPFYEEMDHTTCFTDDVITLKSVNNDANGHSRLYLIVLLFYIFLRNAIALDQELAILYGSFNLTISTKTTLLVKTFVKSCFCFEKAI